MPCREAYEEFEHVLLALMFDKDDQTSPVASEWSEKRRFDIAGLLSSVLRVHLQAFDPIFSMTLGYLTSMHEGFCFRPGISSPVSDLTEGLLIEERDPAPTPQESLLEALHLRRSFVFFLLIEERDPAPTPQESLLEAPPFEEVDVQALAHAVDLTRQGLLTVCGLLKEICYRHLRCLYAYYRMNCAGPAG
ncbi:uncharacterized protein LOC113308430 isoform X1 [Papaver somniferum]|uniref:uncharacterized protein LOC113308430 isoform X1 n=1 Tax=Papaver somniferum TaxID=3469 RepID=UPI000E700661|nr:uncharacterized protein LOC113308430 isoform X1 [Papaver somniferum]XP_026412678.1 uncharacterized protein LOC113308430 isoform X1 [Papaver somniferum]XP_026412679.1 uncharacterized protein LOC113308430 isoform X1 [Papaver somniferum]